MKVSIIVYSRPASVYNKLMLEYMQDKKLNKGPEFRFTCYPGTWNIAKVPACYYIQATPHNTFLPHLSLNHSFVILLSKKQCVCACSKSRTASS